MSIITVKINGMEYNLRGEENDEYLQMIGQYVDNKINILLAKNSKISRPDATILAAINLGDEVFKNKEAYERANENYKMIVREQKELISELEGIKRDLEASRKENDNLKESMETLKENAASKEVEKQNQEITKEIQNQNAELNVEVSELKEQLDIMEQLVRELEYDNKKKNGSNKKLLSEKTDLKYQLLAKVGTIEKLNHELEHKTIELMKNGQTSTSK
ncbi:MAG: cell division protein ZapA [Clostridium sp.]|uniref:cell division protein ZapA n=1 Tax=Clostridium sp. TaxID=1506 RepID=UPI00303B342D